MASGLSSALPIFLSSTANATGTAITVTPSSHSNVPGGSTATSVADTSGHHDVNLSFDYDISDLESDNSLVFGWRIGIGGVNHPLGTIAGAIGNPGPNEIGTKNALISDSGAYSSDLVIYFSNNGSGGSDDVTISNIKLTGVADSLVPPIQSCEVNQPLEITSLASWINDSGSGGHNELTPDGLHVWTDSNTSNDKDANYYYFAIHGKQNLELKDVGSPEIDIAPGFSGVRPSLQLTVDHNGNGALYGNLVYEPWAYGNGKWWSRKDFGIAGGMGYTSFGTLQDYLNENPNTKILAVGYSLGSGVKGDAVIKSISAGCVNYIFKSPAKPVLNTRTNETFDTIQGANDDSDTQNGDTIALNADITVPSQQNITKSITLNGNYHTIYPTFTKTDNSNNSALAVFADGVRINELIVDGKDGTNLHGINTYEVRDLQTWRITVKNNDYSGLNVNRSWVQVVDITTENNGWHGIDVDNPNAYLNSAGINHHNENPQIPAIYVDNRNVGQINDSNNQYVYVDNYVKNGDRAYFMKSLKPAPPANLHQVSQSDGKVYACNVVAQRQAFTPTWTKSTSANVSYYEYSSFNKNHTPGIVGQNIGNVDNFNNSGHWVAPTDGTGYAFAVRAVYKIGILELKSDWAECGITYDSTAPEAPANLGWKTSTNISIPDNGLTNAYDGTATWQASSSGDVDHYIYKYWNDIAGNQYKPGNEYRHNVGGTSLAGVFNQGDGVHHFCVVAVDGAGNESDCSATFTITYDKTVPSAPVISDPTNEQYLNKQPILNKWSASTDNLSGIDYYQVAYLYDDNHTFGGSTCPGEKINGNSLSGCRNTGTNTSRNHTPNASEQGGVTIWVRVYDKAGNVSAWSMPVHYYYDSVAPNVPTLVGPTNGGTYNTHVNDFDFEWDPVTDPSGVKYEWESSLSADVSPNGSFANRLAHHEDLSGTSLPQGASPDNKYFWHVRACDGAGNCSNWSDTWSVTVDTKAPVLAITGVTDNEDGTFTVNGTTDDPGTPVVVKQDGTDLNPVLLDGNNWSVVTDTLSPGDYDFTADSSDSAGNSANQQSFAFNIPESEVEQPKEVLGVSTDNPSNTGSPATSTSALAVVSQPDPRGGRGGNLPVRTYGGNNEDLSVAVESANDPKDDSKPDKEPQVMAAESTNDSNSGETNKDNQSCSKLLGLCWYYWIPIVAVVAIVIWIISRLSNKNESSSI